MITINLFALMYYCLAAICCVLSFGLAVGPAFVICFNDEGAQKWFNFGMVLSVLSWGTVITDWLFPGSPVQNLGIQLGHLAGIF